MTGIAAAVVPWAMPLPLAQATEAFFRNTMDPWQWGVLALIPPAIVALYFLKLKRQPLEVPSTYLWKKSLEDLHVNSLWQQLKKNILLYLQILLVVLGMIALVRPGWQSSRPAGERFILLIDNSASMQANDLEEAPSRLDEAKTRAQGVIDQLEPGMVAMIISFADKPRVVQSFTEDRRLLSRRLASIQPTFAGTDLQGALELADGLANPGRIAVEDEGIEVDVVAAQEATLLIFSDGRFADVKDFSLGNLQPIYVPIGSPQAQNVGISAFTTGRSEARWDDRQAFAQVVNYSTQPQAETVTLKLNGQFLDAQEVTVPAGGEAGIIFPLADAEQGALQVELSHAAGNTAFRDALSLDDVAYAPLNPDAPGEILLVTPGNTPLETALSTERAGKLAHPEIAPPDILREQQYQQRSAAGFYNLVIYDRCTPDAMPRANTVFVGRIPPLSTWTDRPDDADGSAGQFPTADDRAPAVNAPQIPRADTPAIIDVNRAHPLMTSVEMGNVVLLDSLIVPVPPGGDDLIDSTAGVLAAAAPRDSFVDVAIGFEIVSVDANGDRALNTNWPRRYSFPTFWLNVVEFLGGLQEDAQSSQLRPGSPATLKLPAAVASVDVITPRGIKTTVTRSPQETLQFYDTDVPGIYEVQIDGQTAQRFAVNLLDRQESDIRRKPAREVGSGQETEGLRIGNVDVAAASGFVPRRRETWKVFVGLALVILILEWYVYNRRVYL